MVLYLPIVMFLVAIPQMNDGLELPRSIMLLIFCLTYIYIKPRILVVEKKILLLPFLIPIIYLANSYLLDQNILQALFGAYKRNFGILTHLAIAILLLISINSKSIDSYKLFKRTLLPLIAFSIFYSIIQITRNDFYLWAETDRVVLTLGNSNFAAAYLAILLPGVIYGLMLKRNHNNITYKVVFILILTVLIYCGLQTKSFQFNVIALTGIITYLFIYNYNKINKLSRSSRISILGLFIPISVLLIYHFRNILNEFTSADDRISTQIIGLKMFRDHFLLGVGIENYSSYAQLYITPADVRREGYDRFLDKSHNAMIDHFANGGIFTGLIYLSVLIAIFYFTYKLLRADYKLQEELALLGSIFSSYVIQLFFNTDSILLMLIPYIVMGMIAKLYLEKFSQGLTPSDKLLSPSSSLMVAKNSSHVIVRMFTGFLLLAFLALSFRICVTDLQYRKILNEKQVTSERILTTLERWPYPRPTEQVMVAIAQNLQNCALLNTITDRLIIVNKNSSNALFVKALCADFDGNQKLALRFVKKAISLQPLNVRYLDVKYQLENALGLYNEATETLKFIKYIGAPIQ